MREKKVYIYIKHPHRPKEGFKKNNM